MQVKRFFAADMRQAMKQVREELGAEAAIIGNRRVAGGVELTAALDYPLPAESAAGNRLLEQELRKTQAQIAQAHAELSAPVAKADEHDRQLFNSLPEPARSAELTQPVPDAVNERIGLDAVRSELHGLRELIETQLGSLAWGKIQAHSPIQATLWRRLQRMGIPAEVAQPLLERVAGLQEPERAWRMLLAYLAHAIPIPQQEVLEEGGVIALVGPAGMGKTTTLAKLAARYVLKYGAQSLALVSLDSYRLGAQEQLKTLGRILGVSVTLVDPAQSLLQALAPLARKRLVLVDTAGLPATDAALRQQLEMLAGRGLKARNYLVLSATCQGQVLKAAYHTYKRCGLSGCIISKLDESASLGEVLGVAIGHALPVAYVTDGPGIPDDLQFCRGHHLVSRAMSLLSPGSPSEETMAGVMASLNRPSTSKAS